MPQTPGPASSGAQPSDPWYARLAFHTLRKAAPWWVTLWLLMTIGGLIALGAVADSWVPGVITAVGALAAGGTAVAKRIGGKPPTKPDPALDPPP